MNQGASSGTSRGAEVVTTTQLACWLIDGAQAFTRDPIRGRRLLEFAAHHGDVVAMRQLATRLEKGRGLDLEPETARYWLTRARRRERRLANLTPL